MSTLDNLQAVLGLTADEGAQQVIDRKLCDPSDPLVLFLEGVRTQGEQFTNCGNSFDGSLTEWADTERAWQEAATKFDSRRLIWRWLPFVFVAAVCGAILAWAVGVSVNTWFDSTVLSVGAIGCTTVIMLVLLIRRCLSDRVPQGTLLEAAVGSVVFAGFALVFSIPLFVFQFADFLSDAVLLAGLIFGAWIGIDHGLGLRDKLLLRRQTVKQIVTRIMFVPLAMLGPWFGVALFLYNLDPTQPLTWLWSIYLPIVLLFAILEGITDEKFPVGNVRELVIGTVLSGLVALPLASLGALAFWFSGYDPTMWWWISAIGFSWFGISECYHRGLISCLGELGDSLRIGAGAGFGTLIAITAWEAAFELTVGLFPESEFVILIVGIALAVFVCWKFLAPKIGQWVQLPRLAAWLISVANAEQDHEFKLSRAAALGRGLLPTDAIGKIVPEVWFALKDWLYELTGARRIVASEGSG